MSKIALTAGQLSYWRKKLGNDASSGAIDQARTSKLTIRKPQAPAGAAPSPGDNPPLPFNPVYEQTVAAVDRNMGIGDAEYGFEVDRAKSRYGIEDSSDPFSRQAMLNKQFGDAKASTRGQYAAAGQLQSSAQGNAQDRVKYGYDAQSSSNANQYQDLLHELAQRKINQHAQGQDTKSLAAADALQQAMTTPPDPMEAPTPAPKPKKKAAPKKSSFSNANLQLLAQKLNLR